MRCLSLALLFFATVAIATDPVTLDWNDVPAKGDKDWRAKVGVMKEKYGGKQVRVTGVLLSADRANDRLIGGSIGVPVKRGEVRTATVLQVWFEDKRPQPIMALKGKTVTLEGTGDPQASYEFPFSLRNCEVVKAKR